MIAKFKQYLLVPKSYIRWTRYFFLPAYSMAIGLIVISIYLSFIYAPEDAVQGNVFRIIYVHVPLAMLSLGLYTALAVSSFVFWVWHIKMADYAAISCAIVGIIMCILTLITGSIWAKPTWGSWWIWDARLTSECILLILYAGYLSIRIMLKPIEIARKVSCIIACLGIVDVPLVHYSVQWWYTLHQGSTILKLSTPSIAWDMLWPLLLSIISFALLSLVLVMHTASVYILFSEKNIKVNI